MLLAASPYLPATLSVFHLQINFKVFEFHAINSVLQAPQGRLLAPLYHCMAGISRFGLVHSWNAGIRPCGTGCLVLHWGILFIYTALRNVFHECCFPAHVL